MHFCSDISSSIEQTTFLSGRWNHALLWVKSQDCSIQLLRCLLPRLPRDHSCREITAFNSVSASIALPCHPTGTLPGKKQQETGGQVRWQADRWMTNAWATERTCLPLVPSLLIVPSTKRETLRCCVRTRHADHFYSNTAIMQRSRIAL